MEYYKIIYVYLIGAVVILGMQFLNMISILLEIPSWSSVLMSAMQDNLSALPLDLNIVSIISLFIITPLIIGILSYIVSKTFMA